MVPHTVVNQLTVENLADRRCSRAHYLALSIDNGFGNGEESRKMPSHVQEEAAAIEIVEK